MQTQISHRHEGWDEATEDYSKKRLRRLERTLLARNIAPAPLHLSIREEGHGHTECSARLFLPRTVLKARASDHSLLVAMRSVFDDLEQQLRRHWRRGARHPRSTARREILVSGLSPTAACRGGSVEDVLLDHSEERPLSWSQPHIIGTAARAALERWVRRREERAEQP